MLKKLSENEIKEETVKLNKALEKYLRVHPDLRVAEDFRKQIDACISAQSLPLVMPSVLINKVRENSADATRRGVRDSLEQGSAFEMQAVL